MSRVRATTTGTITTTRLLSSTSPDELDEAHPNAASHHAAASPLSKRTTATTTTTTTTASARKASRQIIQEEEQVEEVDPLRLATDDCIFDEAQQQKQQQQQVMRTGPRSDKSSPPTPGRSMHHHLQSRSRGAHAQGNASGSGSASASNEVQLMPPPGHSVARALAPHTPEHHVHAHQAVEAQGGTGDSGGALEQVGEAEAQGAEAEGEGEDGNMPLLVFQCDVCGVVLGDSMAWVVARRDLGLLVLSAVTPAVLTQKENQTSSIPGPDLGSTYSVLSCQPCGSVLGRAYKTTPRPLDELRDAYALEVDAVRVYRLGSDLPPRNEEVGEEPQARGWDYAQEQRHGQPQRPVPPAQAPQREESSVVPSGPSVEDHRVRVLLMGLGERLVRVERELHEFKASSVASSHQAAGQGHSSRHSGILPPMAPPMRAQPGSSTEHAWSPPIDDAGEREAFRRHEQATSAKRLAADRMLAQFDHRGQPLAAKRPRPRKQPPM